MSWHTLGCVLAELMFLCPRLHQTDKANIHLTRLTAFSTGELDPI